EGVRRTRDLSGRADIVIYLVDGVAGITQEDLDFLASHEVSLKVWNKIDKPECGALPAGWIGISAKKALNLDLLCKAMVGQLQTLDGTTAEGRNGQGQQQAGQGQQQAGLIASERQKTLVDACARSVSSAMKAMDDGTPLDAVALCLREASDFLGQITGEIGSEEVFERIFGTFCLGK
ncbi:MAG: hypothetical protein LLF89_03955, partial [Spirochaetaceae bacterium]|nr:hypothetical protein [Spirochaetaceae bacterium]